MTYIDYKQELMHLAFCLRDRSRSLASFDNALRFIGLGIAPLIILAAIKTNNPVILNISLTISGLLSLTNWIWSIGTLVFKLDRHIEISKTYPVTIDSFLAESDAVIIADKNQITGYEKRANDLLIEIKKKIEETNYQVPNWLNVKAQQSVLARTKLQCGSCNQKWISKTLYEEREIKRILKNKKLIGKTHCLKCAQRIN